MNDKAKYKFIWPDSSTSIIEADDIESAAIKAAANRINTKKPWNSMIAVFAQEPNKKTYAPVKTAGVLINLKPRQ